MKQVSFHLFNSAINTNKLLNPDEGSEKIPVGAFVIDTENKLMYIVKDENTIIPIHSSKIVFKDATNQYTIYEPSDLFKLPQNINTETIKYNQNNELTVDDEKIEDNQLLTYGMVKKLFEVRDKTIATKKDSFFTIISDDKQVNTKNWPQNHLVILPKAIGEYSKGFYYYNNNINKWLTVPVNWGVSENGET